MFLLGQKHPRQVARGRKSQPAMKVMKTTKAMKARRVTNPNKMGDEMHGFASWMIY